MTYAECSYYILVTDCSVTILIMKSEKTLKHNTKQLILDAAFSFFEKPNFNQFSMSEIAKKVGITKPAIYRHFVCRDQIIQEMENSFFEVLQNSFLASTDFKTEKEFNNYSLTTLIKIFSDKPEFINYFVSQISFNKKFEKRFLLLLRKQGVHKELQSIIGSGFNEKDFEKSIEFGFLFFSFVFFIKTRNAVLQKNQNFQKINDKENENRIFAEKLLKFIQCGLFNSLKEILPFENKAISPERLTELNKICRLNKEDFSEENKIFKAVAEVIKKNQFKKITVEQIADELNMSKSSLYFYFENKNQMLYSLIDNELTLLQTICQENITESKNYIEEVYIILRTELEFFLMRPSIIPTCGWLLQAKTEADVICEEELFISPTEKKLCEAFSKIDLGFTLTPNIFSIWIRMIPVNLIIVCTKNKLPDQKIFESLSLIFGFLQNGISYE